MSVCAKTCNFSLADCDCDTLNLALLQYNFSQGEHKIVIAPHGNSRSGQSYMRTMPSVMCKLKQEAKKNTPKRVLQFVSEASGGIMEATSAGALPRGRQQIKDARRKNTSKQDFDPLYSIMHMCKEGEGRRDDNFIRMVNAAPYPMMLIAFDYTLNDLVRFCTSADNFSILGVDPTFNLGDFDVTVTTYRHLLLQPRETSGSKPPVMLGPMFIHVRKDFTAYHFFSSTLVGQRPHLSSLKAFGTDGELALENALKATFPMAQHVRCFLHFRGNIERKLQELNLPRSASSEIVHDIMGSPMQLQHGLVDAKTVEEMDDMLKRFESRWNELEKPYNSPPFFHTWFLKHCHKTVSECMLPTIREKAGLGSPPSPYYTNEVESKNRILKEAVQYKSSQLPEFVDKMKGLMEEQRREIERAVIGSGEYRLRKEYHHLTVEPSKWFKMTTEQRRRKLDQFMKADLRIHLSPSEISNCPLDSLSLPPQVATAMWRKAEDLARDEMAIVQAPGDSNAWMVRSTSSKRPHYVRVLKNSYVCDDQCVSYKSMKICSHSVAIAIKLQCVDNLLKSYRTMKCTPNFTALAEAGKPATAGKKTVRKGVSKKCSREIKKFVMESEEAGLEWNPRSGPQQPMTEIEPSHSQAPPQLIPQDPQASSSAYPATTLFMSQRDVHIGSIGSVNSAVTSPPPLIQTQPDRLFHSPSSNATPGVLSQIFSPQHRPCVETPFWIVFIFGNVSRCNGCKGRICRDQDKKVLPPPDDIVLGHKEFVVFQNSRSGLFEQSKDKRNVYYHPWKTCIAPHFSDFDPNRHIIVQESVKEKLLRIHKEFLSNEFGLFL